MRSLFALQTLLTCASLASAAAVPSPRDGQDQPHLHQHDSPNALRIPTSYESAVLGRRILALTPLGTLVTVFPHDKDTGPAEHRPAGMGGSPVGMVEYVADCERSRKEEDGVGTGNPTLLALTVATPFRNVRAGSNVSLSLRWTPPYPPAKRIRATPSPPMGNLFSRALKRILRFSSDDGDDDERPDPAPYSAANLPRFSLFGHIEPIDNVDNDDELARCFTSVHPDARYWLPGNPIHESRFVRLVVTHVYWVGGFGDRAYIGWIPADEWHRVSRAEWEAVRLPGERKGWKEWALGEDEDSWAWGDL
ncbi:hypothetical protein VTK73DRAFT_9943 [Phialemonium thermophilum]|uniref:CREG-like beta-barrel domain-containing protein n=1 Tax=Phialemonium thermophilum TaxID=223376 RepID=A0ABR3XIB3_9PEZI